MRRIKVIISMLLAVALLLSGCGKNANKTEASSSASSDITSSENDTTTLTEVTEEPTEPATTDGAIIQEGTEEQTEAVAEPVTEASTENQTQQQTEATTQKQTEKQTQKQTEAVTQKQTEKQTQKQTEAVTQKQTEKQTQKQTEAVTQKQTEKQTQKQTEAVTEQQTTAAPVEDRSNLFKLKDVVNIPIEVFGANGWAQNSGYTNILEQIWDYMVPGAVLEIDFKLLNPNEGNEECPALWIVLPACLNGWQRVGSSTLTNNGKAICNNSKTICQIPYELIKAVAGAKAKWGDRLQCESYTDWQVTGIKVGTRTEELSAKCVHNYNSEGECYCGAKAEGADVEVDIADAELREAIRDRLNMKSTDAINYYAIEKLTSLNIGSAVKDLAPLKYAKNLTEININFDSSNKKINYNSLYSLNITTMAVSGDVPKDFMQGMKKIENLDATNAHCYENADTQTGECDQYFVVSPALNQIAVSATNDGNIDYLFTCTNIKSITIYDYVFEHIDTDLPKFEQLPKLRKLYLEYNENIAYEEWNALADKIEEHDILAWWNWL